MDPLRGQKQPIEPISWVGQLLLVVLLYESPLFVLKELPGSPGSATWTSLVIFRFFFQSFSAWP
jgi:hypothetical protein